MLEIVTGYFMSCLIVRLVTLRVRQADLYASYISWGEEIS